MNAATADRSQTVLGWILAALLLPVLGMALLLCLSIYFLMVGTPLLFVSAVPIVVYVTGLRHEPALNGMALGCSAFLLVLAGACAPLAFRAIADPTLNLRWLALCGIAWWMALLVTTVALALMARAPRRPKHGAPRAWATPSGR